MQKIVENIFSHIQKPKYKKKIEKNKKVIQTGDIFEARSSTPEVDKDMLPLSFL